MLSIIQNPPLPTRIFLRGGVNFNYLAPGGGRESGEKF